MKKQKYILTALLATTLLIATTSCTSTLKTNINSSIHLKYDTIRVNLKQVGQHLIAKVTISRRNLPQLSDIKIPPKNLNLQADTTLGLRTPDETPGIFATTAGTYRTAYASFLFKNLKKQDVQQIRLTYGKIPVIFIQNK